VNLATNAAAGDAAGDVISGFEQVVGGTGGDSLTGDGAANLIDGGSGNDTILGGAGADTLTGGVGTADRLDYTGSNAGVTVNLSGGTGLNGHAAGDELSGFEEVLGSALADSITGDSGNNQLTGADGGDTLTGGDGNDLLYGGLGDDVLGGGLGNDLLFADAGNDSIDGGGGFDWLSFGSSTTGLIIDLSTGTFGGDAAGDTIVNVEQIIGTGFDDTIIGGAEDNNLGGGAGNDFVDGGDGNDTLSAGLGDDTLDGGNGFDIADYSASSGGVNVDLENDIVSGGDAQNDTFLNIEGVLGSTFDDTLYGDIFANLISGGTGNDYLFGDGGADTLFGDAGMDTIDGSAGNDVLIFTASTAAISIDLDIGNGTGAGYAGDASGDIYTGVEVIYATVFNDTVLGNAAFNILIGNAGNDSLTGDAGEDTLTGGLGADRLDGGTDVDVISYSGSSAGVSVNLTTGAGLGGDAQGDVISNVEIVEASEFNDTLTGNTGINQLFGFGGDDLLYGGDADDRLFGGEGNDTLEAGAGADSLDGDNGIDAVSYAASASAVTINLNAVFQLGGDALGDILTQIEQVYGSGFNDSLLGGSLNELLAGGNGDDTLAGGTGADTLQGGAGNDTYQINSILDVADETGGSGTDEVLSTVTFTLGAGIENLTLTGSVDISGTGNASDNVIDGNSAIGVGSIGLRGINILYGGGGNDTLYGNGGNDTLDGGTGADLMIGGADSDAYVVDSAGDVITEGNVTGLDTVFVAINYTLGDYLEDLIIYFAPGITATGLSVTGNIANNRMYGFTGDDNISGLEGNDLLVGNSGNDTLDGGTGTDTLAGGFGDDTYIIATTTDTIQESANQGFDTVRSDINFTLFNGVEALILTGGTATTGIGSGENNLITGNGLGNALSGAGGNDTLNGGLGNDSLDGGSGSDSLIGGLGDDLFTVDSASDMIVELVGQGNDTIQSAQSSTTIAANVEVLQLLGTANIAAIGDAAANTLIGNSGGNLLSGLGGADSLYGGDGADTLDGGASVNLLTGGAGNDTYILTNATDVVVEATNGGIDIVSTELTVILATEVENLLLTGITAAQGTGNVLANQMTGNTGNNRLNGLDGNDTLIGGGGNDTLDGGIGNDILYGGVGNDVFYIDNAADTVIEFAPDGIDRVFVGYSYTLAANVENLTLQGIGAINGTGNSSANALTGNTGANQLFGDIGNDTLAGGGGNDTLNGGSGTDSMNGGAGDDLFVVDSATDIVTEAASQGTDTVRSGFNWTLANNVERLEFTGTANTTGVGNTGANTLVGNTGANGLQGLGGADTLNGGAGGDTMTGGSGADQFLFTASSNGATDLITDYNTLDSGAEEGDLLVFQGLLVGAFAYRGTGAFTGGSNNTEARVSGNSVQIDTDGNGVANFTIVMTGLTTASQLQAADFLFI